MLLDPNDPDYQQKLAAAQNVAPRDRATNALYENVGSIGGGGLTQDVVGGGIGSRFSPTMVMPGYDTPQQMGGPGLVGGSGDVRQFAGFGDDLSILGRPTPSTEGQPIGSFNTTMGSLKDDPLFNLRQYNAQNTPNPQMQGFTGSANQAFGQGVNGYSGAGTQSGSASGGAGGSGAVFPLQGNYGIVKMQKGGLTAAAKYLESQGRGNDSRLMHVSPRELQGLQALAKAKGGSLSVNPSTGLLEAGFLEDILPVAAAGAMMAFAPGVAPAIGGALGLGEGALATGVGMGLLSGGITALTTGNVNKGLQAGLLSGATAGLMSNFMGAPSTAEVPTSNVQTPVPAVEMSRPPVDVTSAPGYEMPPTGGYPTSQQTANFMQGETGQLTPQSLSSSQTPANQSWWGSLSGKEKLGYGLAGTAALSLLGQYNTPKIAPLSTTTPTIRPYTYNQTRNPNWGQPGQTYYNQGYTALPTYAAAKGGLLGSAGPVEQMSRENSGQQTYPMSMLDTSKYSTPFQIPIGTSVIDSDYEPKTNPFTGEMKRMADGGSAASGYIPTSQAVQDYQKMLSDRAAEEYLRNPMPAALMPASKRPAISLPTTQPTLMPYYGDNQPSMAAQAGLPQYTYNPVTRSYTSIAQQPPVAPPVEAPIQYDQNSGGKAGGLMPYNLGSYSDGGRLLKGPGDGMSDNIPATIGNKQPARLADGEFVVPADVVSHLGNGSTDAGAKKLYAMMDKVRTARVGTKKQGKEIKAEKYLPT